MKPDLTGMPLAELGRLLVTLRRDHRATVREMAQYNTGDRRGLLDDKMRLARDIAKVERVMRERS